MNGLTVVIPAYNEERGITDITGRVLAIKPELAKVGVSSLELLVINDGSMDKTADVVASIEGVTLIDHPKNRGYGAALKTGFSKAKTNLIGFLDADGTYPPEYFPKLCAAALEGADIVIGTRMAGADSKMPLTRRMGNLFFATLLSLIGRQKVTDSASGMRVFKKEVLSRIYPLPDGLNLTPVMSTRAIHEGVSIVEIPIPYSERVGSSKLSVVRDGSLFLQSIVWTALTYNPVRIMGLIGLAGITIAIVIALGVLVARLSGITQLGAWGVAAVFAALVTSITGISIFSLGVTFNYLIALFYKKPIQQGLFGRRIFKTPLDRHFWWLGLLFFVGGVGLGTVSLILGMNGWTITRLWLYFLASAMMVLMGTQFVIYWILLRALEEISKREGFVQQELEPKVAEHSGNE